MFSCSSAMAGWQLEYMNTFDGTRINKGIWTSGRLNSNDKRE